MINRGYHIETEILQKNIVTSGEHFSNLLTRSDQRVLGSLTSKYRRHEWYGVECNKASANYPTSMLKQSVIASNHCTTSTSGSFVAVSLVTRRSTDECHEALVHCVSACIRRQMAVSVSMSLKCYMTLNSTGYPHCHDLTEVVYGRYELVCCPQ